MNLLSNALVDNLRSEVENCISFIKVQTMCKKSSLCSHDANDAYIFVGDAEGINQILKLSQDISAG